MDKKLIKWVKITGVSTLAIPAKVGQCRPWLREQSFDRIDYIDPNDLNEQNDPNDPNFI